MLFAELKSCLGHQTAYYKHFNCVRIFYLLIYTQFYIILGIFAIHCEKANVKIISNLCGFHPLQSDLIPHPVFNCIWRPSITGQEISPLAAVSQDLSLGKKKKVRKSRNAAPCELYDTDKARRRRETLLSIALRAFNALVFILSRLRRTYLFGQHDVERLHSKLAHAERHIRNSSAAISMIKKKKAKCIVL